MSDVCNTAHSDICQVTIKNIISLASLQEKTQSEILPPEIIGYTIYIVRVRITNHYPVCIRYGRVIVKIPVLYFSYHTLSFRTDTWIRGSHDFSQIIIETIFYVPENCSDRIAVTLQEYIIRFIP